jgi:hypothetical protein
MVEFEAISPQRANQILTKLAGLGDGKQVTFFEKNC